MDESDVDQTPEVLGHQALDESGVLDALRDTALPVNEQPEQEEPVRLPDGREDGRHWLIGVRAGVPVSVFRDGDRTCLPNVECRRAPVSVRGCR